MKIPQGKYVSGVEINEGEVVVNFKKKQKVALVFISLNPLYWPYLKDVLEDAKVHFLPHHNVDVFAWTDIPTADTPEYTQLLSELPAQEQLDAFAKQGGIPKIFSREKISDTVQAIRKMERVKLIETGAIQWPAPTLMRFHLFLNEKETLKDYDYIFYLDADMRIVQKISDEILGEGLTTAPHPGYAVNERLIPPLEPNPDSAAYIPRLGQLVDVGGKKRFMPFYAAGGFQGGKAKEFIKAMEVMKKNIDLDFDNNYTAIWNDESHWNKYLWDYQKKGGDITFLDVSYVYPDSLIQEYYEKLVWGRSFQPKIITLTKPFSLSSEGGVQLGDFLSGTFRCPTCQDPIILAGHKITSVLTCNGQGQPHQVSMEKL